MILLRERIISFRRWPKVKGGNYPCVQVLIAIPTRPGESISRGKAISKTISGDLYAQFS